MTKKMVTVLAVVMAMTGVAFAGPPADGECPHGGRGAGGPGHPIMMALRQVDLTDDQRAILRDARESAQGDREADRGQMEALRGQIADELTSSNPSQTKVEALMDQMDAIRDSHRSERLSVLFDVLATLTPDQRAQLKVALESMPEGPPERGPRGGGHGGPPHQR